MKIVAILDTNITAGGGFGQALNAILQMHRLSVGRFEFEVFTTLRENLTILGKFKLTAHFFSYSIVDKFLSEVSNNVWWWKIQNILKMIGPLEKALLEHQCDLVYFVTPAGIAASLQRLNYITTIWDLAHRDTPEFPEVRNYSEYHRRERDYKNNLGKALIIITDSSMLSKIAAFRYGIDHNRFLAMPFSPSPLILEENEINMDEVLKKHDLKSGYFYYPAQFWAHKNHIRILEALQLLRSDGHFPTVVFSGKDNGNKTYLEDYVRRHGLQEQVSFVGFVPAGDVSGLYRGALAVLIPTYFGPTNLPPLEAWLLGKPLIYSAHLKEQAGDAALLVDPDSASDLSKAMIACTNESIRADLINRGRNQLKSVELTHIEGERVLLAKLAQFATRRRCWM